MARSAFGIFRSRLTRDRKQSTPIKELCETFPDEYSIYLNYVRKLGFEETPDYDFLRELFSKVLKNLGEPEDGVYDWMLLNNGKGWEAGSSATNLLASSGGAYADRGDREHRHRSSGIPREQRERERAEREERRAAREAQRASQQAAANERSGIVSASTSNAAINGGPSSPSPALVRHGSKGRDGRRDRMPSSGGAPGQYGTGASDVAIPPASVVADPYPSRRQSNQHPYASGGAASSGPIGGGGLDASSYAPDGRFRVPGGSSAVDGSTRHGGGGERPANASGVYGNGGRYDNDGGVHGHDGDQPPRSFGQKMIDLFTCRC